MIISADGELTGAEAANIASVQQHDIANFTESAKKIASGTGTAADQATVMDGSAANLVSAAGSGFKLDHEAAVTLATSCGESLAILNSVQQHIGTLQRAPKLGSLPGAPGIATFTRDVATDPEGIAKAVQSLQATLEQMQTAYEKAAANYEQTEQDVKDALSKFVPPAD